MHRVLQSSVVRSSLVNSLALAVCICAGVAVPRTASAAPSPAEVNAAREAYREGVGLETTGNWAAALEKFRAVAAVKSTSRVRFHIGLCQEKLGRWVEALGAYNLALADARQESAADVEKEAEAARASLDVRIPRLTVLRGQTTEAISVSVDGVALGAASIGTEIPLDPGVHTVETSSPGRAPFRVNVELTEGVRKTVDAIPPSSSGPVPAASATPVASDNPSSSPAWPWLAVGVGAASLAASGVFYLLRQGKVSSLEDACGSEYHCSEAERPVYDSARTYNTLTNVTLGVGVLGVGAGTILLLTAKKPSRSTSSATHPTSSPHVGVGLLPSGVTLAGRF